MIIEITLNNIKVKRQIPTSWEEVKFKDFLEITKDPADTTRILSVLTGIEYETLKKAKLANADDVILALSFFQKDAPLTIPETILGYTVPTDLGFETVAQYEDLKLHLKECNDKKITPQEQLAFYPLYCAIYACSQKHGEYDWKKAESFAEHFLHAPAAEVLAIGNFTLTKLIGLNLGIKSNVPIPPTRLKKLTQGLSVWVKSLVLQVQLYFWKRKHLTKKPSY